MAFAKVHGITGQKDLQLMRRRDHLAMACVISAIRAVRVSGSRHVITSPCALSMVAAELNQKTATDTGTAIDGAK